MKFYSLEWAAKQNWRLGSTPKPFPGRWPTRLYIRAGKASYLGKPHRSLPQHFDGEAGDMLVEFDRAGAVYLMDFHTHELRAERLFRFYHYWQQAVPWGEHLRTPVYPKRLGGWTVYSPYKTLKLAYIDQWKEFAAEFARVKRKRASGTPIPVTEAAPAGAETASPSGMRYWGTTLLYNDRGQVVGEDGRRVNYDATIGSWVYAE